LEKREELLREFVREVRQFNEFGASFFRSVAGRIGMNVTDLQVADILDVTGPTTAGRLAELTGLTTGAITQMLDRLEKDGVVRRERDPEDGRRVIVRLAPSEDAMRKIGPIFDSIGQEWGQVASGYDDEQLTFLLEFLRRSNAKSQEEIAGLREVPAGGDRDFSAPLGDLESARLVFPSGAIQLNVRAHGGMDELYRAHFEGTIPDVKVRESTVTIRYPRKWLLIREKRTAEVALSVAVPWQIVFQGGASEIDADLRGLNLLGLEVNGGMSMIKAELPEPSSVVPVRIAGGASEINIRRPAGVAARVHLKGWASTLAFDDQSYDKVGADVRLQSPGYDDAAGRYDFEILGSASTITLGSE
ncbi:MAG TPA: MarR family transcriptional regulator, partial [Ktedonobacterales bacterium]|jgi:DNA-binding MarR family transcriptional regulator|nr:MarR family transcriptional regulator [Ktedonobacterales bacterium]